MRRRVLALSAGLAALLSAGTVGAYCGTSSCDPDLPDAHTGAVCTPPQPDDCGIAIAWAEPCTELSVQKDGSPKRNITAAQLAQLMTTAFATWMSAPCPGGGTPHILVTQGPEVSCDQHEYNSTEGNAESILFHDDVWPYEGSANVLALTTVSYDRDTGAIYDADMELNSADTDFTLGDTGVDYDLLSIVTHESGHFLGLAHSADATATMFHVYDAGTTSERTLAPDDIAAICAVYPPAGPVTDCDPTPRHGFSALCGAEQPPLPSSPSSGACCSVAPGSGGGVSPVAWYAGALAALGALLLAARGRGRRAPRASRRRTAPRPEPRRVVLR